MLTLAPVDSFLTLEFRRFGLLNIIARPCGGIFADVIYRRLDERRGLLAKKCKLKSVRVKTDACFVS